MKVADVISSMCWCGSRQVEIPVAFVREGQTEPCGLPGCGPGCEMVGEGDSFEDPEPVGDDELRIVVGERLCACGCTETVSAKSKFRMGHDARTKSNLARAYANHITVALVDHDTGVVTRTSALEYAARFSGKVDWPMLVRSTAAGFAGQTAPERPARSEMGLAS